MSRDPFEALDSYFASQPRCGTGEFDQTVNQSLESELVELSFAPIVSSMRRVFPVAAAILIGVLTPGVSQSDIQELSNRFEQAQASSVRTELENSWEH